MERYKTDIDKEKDDMGRTEVGRNEQSSHKGNVNRAQEEEGRQHWLEFCFATALLRCLK